VKQSIIILLTFKKLRAHLEIGSEKYPFVFFQHFHRHLLRQCLEDPVKNLLNALTNLKGL